MKPTGSILTLTLALLVAPLAGLAAPELPETTTDGLRLVKGTEARAVYMAEGADLSQYDKLAMLKAYVAFKKNWKKEHNREASTLEDRVSDKDMQKIRDKLAEEFAKVFVEVLEKEGGHEFVKDAGAGVLILRPAIIDLDVAAPDLMQPDTSTFVASAGSMTLYLEMYDGKTGAKIVEVIDPQAASDGMWHYSNSVTNKSQADRVIRRWAELLNKHLAEVKTVTSPGS
jgi:hypothetical protein